MHCYLSCLIKTTRLSVLLAPSIDFEQCAKEQHVDLIRSLLRAHADVFTVDQSGRSAFHHARSSQLCLELVLFASSKRETGTPDDKSAAIIEVSGG